MVVLLSIVVHVDPRETADSAAQGTYGDAEIFLQLVRVAPEDVGVAAPISGTIPLPRHETAHVPEGGEEPLVRRLGNPQVEVDPIGLQ
jgi:hypothetical protein